MTSITSHKQLTQRAKSLLSHHYTNSSSSNQPLHHQHRQQQNIEMCRGKYTALDKYYHVNGNQAHRTEVESIIAEKKTLLKNSKDVDETDILFAELEGLEWLQRQIARFS